MCGALTVALLGPSGASCLHTHVTFAIVSVPPAAEEALMRLRLCCCGQDIPFRSSRIDVRGLRKMLLSVYRMPYAHRRGFAVDLGGVELHLHAVPPPSSPGRP